MNAAIEARMGTTSWEEPDRLRRFYMDGSEAALIEPSLGGWKVLVWGPYSKLSVVTMDVNVPGHNGRELARGLADVALGHEAGRWCVLPHTTRGSLTNLVLLGQGGKPKEAAQGLIQALGSQLDAWIKGGGWEPPKDPVWFVSRVMRRMPAGGPTRLRVYGPMPEEVPHA